MTDYADPAVLAFNKYHAAVAAAECAGYYDAVNASPQLRRFGEAVSEAEQQFITTIATTNAGLLAQARHLVEVYGEDDDPLLHKLITTLCAGMEANYTADPR